MICYYDTSFLISAVLGQHREIDYDKYWNDVVERVSSHLVRIESVIAIRRAGMILSRSHGCLRSLPDSLRIWIVSHASASTTR